MLSNISTSMHDNTIDYPIADSTLPFSDYVARCRALIAKRRPDLQQKGPKYDLILDANSPFELRPICPTQTGEQKIGVLLIHGLLDCPFTFRDLAPRFQAQGMLCRSVLLPGHGTKPNDLLDVNYQDWIQAVRYGIETLKQEVDQIFLVGYSTGAALSVYHALQDKRINGIILLAPAIKIKMPVDVLVGWHSLLKWFSTDKNWLYHEDEVDYAKYLSITFNAVNQVGKLTDLLDNLNAKQALECPVFMAISHEDETISSHTAEDFFTSLPNQASKLLLYTSYNHAYPDPRILVRQTHYPLLNIKHFAHVSIPFAANNPHYGQQGDYSFASHRSNEFIYGAYNHVESNIFAMLYKFNLVKYKRRELTYNPDFDFMVNQICQFIFSSTPNAKTA